MQSWLTFSCSVVSLASVEELRCSSGCSICYWFSFLWISFVRMLVFSFQFFVRFFPFHLYFLHVCTTAKKWTPGSLLAAVFWTFSCSPGSLLAALLWTFSCSPGSLLAAVLWTFSCSPGSLLAAVLWTWHQLQSCTAAVSWTFSCSPGSLCAGLQQCMQYLILVFVSMDKSFVCMLVLSFWFDSIFC